MADSTQIITFRYQQEGTAKGFNQLLHNIIPYGVIDGGDIAWDNTSGSWIATVSPIELIIYDSTQNVAVHIKTTETTEVPIPVNSSQKPYLIAKFPWQESKENVLTFEFVNLESINQNTDYIILGIIEFSGDTPQSVDKKCRQQSSICYNNDFLFENDGSGNTIKRNYPSFYVTVPTNYQNKTSSDGNQWNALIYKGRAIINGKEVSNDTARTYICEPTVTIPSVGLPCILVIDENSVFHFLQNITQAPKNCLPIAYINYVQGDTYLRSERITYIYNNNYVSSSSSYVDVANHGLIV